MRWQDDMENFKKCSEPHESSEAGLKAMNGFMDELAELRRKYRMRNVWLVGTFNAVVDGEPDELVFTGGWGEYQKSLDLYSYAFGVAYGDSQNRLDRIFLNGKDEGSRDDHVVGRSDG